jgi:hypothetical protein
MFICTFFKYYRTFLGNKEERKGGVYRGFVGVFRIFALVLFSCEGRFCFDMPFVINLTAQRIGIEWSRTKAQQ